MTAESPPLPFTPQVISLTGVTGSVPPDQLPALLRSVQHWLGSRRDQYHRQYELAAETDLARIYYVDAGHWDYHGPQLDLTAREIMTVRRAHAEELRWTLKHRDDCSPPADALDIRDAVVIARPD